MPARGSSCLPQMRTERPANGHEVEHGTGVLCVEDHEHICAVLCLPQRARQELFGAHTQIRRNSQPRGAGSVGGLEQGSRCCDREFGDLRGESFVGRRVNLAYVAIEQRENAPRRCLPHRPAVDGGVARAANRPPRQRRVLPVHERAELRSANLHAVAGLCRTPHGNTPTAPVLSRSHPPRPGRDPEAGWPAPRDPRRAVATGTPPTR
jgi:hypothetical protein